MTMTTRQLKLALMTRRFERLATTPIVTCARWTSMAYAGSALSVLVRASVAQLAFQMLADAGIVELDYDLCATCWATDRSKHRNGRHKFARITKPGEIFVHRVREEPTTPRATGMNSPVPTAVPPVNVAHDNQAEVVHNATCDLCDSHILGVRYKCTRCPDYDVCASCFP